MLDEMIMGPVPLKDPFRKFKSMRRVTISWQKYANHRLIGTSASRICRLRIFDC